MAEPAAWTRCDAVIFIDALNVKIREGQVAERCRSTRRLGVHRGR